MDFWTRVLQILDTQMTEPTCYGTFHLLWLGITVAACLLLAFYGKKMQTHTIIKIVLVTALMTLALETYKQINYTFGDGSSAPSYKWYAFPFQFCSTPMYIGLLAGLIKKGKFHDALCAYLATFGLFAGIVVMLYPGDVFTETAGINIQTMFWHGSMVAMGVFLLASGHVQLRLRTVLKALPVFATTVLMAVCMNEIAFRTGLLENHNFNMFYISPYCDPSLPVYSLVQAVLPFPWSLAVYVLGFTAAATIVLATAMGVAKLGCRNSKHMGNRGRILRYPVVMHGLFR